MGLVSEWDSYTKSQYRALNGHLMDMWNISFLLIRLAKNSKNVLGYPGLFG